MYSEALLTGQNLSLSEALAMGGQTTVIGLAIVFAVLIIVLTAAVAASLNTSTYNLRIKSYRRTDNKMPAWNKAGVTETINNRF